MEYDNYDDDDYEYDDVADDWEADADAVEAREKAEQVAKAALAEKKLLLRAPVARKEKTENVLPDDIQREVDYLREMATDIASGSGLISGASAELIADYSLESASDAEKIALGKEFSGVKTINDEIARVHVAHEELKRGQRNQKKKKTPASAIATQDTLNFDFIQDKARQEKDDSFDNDCDDFKKNALNDNENSW